MERVLRHLVLKSLILLISILGLAQSSFATSVIVPSDDEMIIGARAIVRGKVVAIESSFDEQRSRIYTYITVKVREVIKGEINERLIVLKELGGQVGEEGFRVYGNPEFKRGEKVLLYLDTWKDGSLRTHHMFLGKFSITEDEATGEQFVLRSGPDEGVSALPRTHAQSSDAVTDRMQLSLYLQMVNSRLQANFERSQNFQDTHYRNVPLLAEPREYSKLRSQGDIEPHWTFIHSAHPRWFEPDSGQPVTFLVNPADAPNPEIVNDINAAMNAWSTVPNCALRIVNGGSTSACNEAIGLNLILFNACDGRWSPSPGCSGTLALGGLSWTGNTTVINGTTFRQATGGFISFNPNASCHFGVHCNVQEITTHELGHAIGLGHSADSTATMYAFAHFDGRCASLRPDDIAGVQFMYPGAGGPGPLAITTSALLNGAVGAVYSQTLQASGGTAPYTWSIVSGLGNLPTGLLLNATTGIILGTPTATGTHNFTVRVTDSASATAQRALSIVISATGGAAFDSQFVSQTVPTTLNPGQLFQANLKFLNTGTQTWSGSLFFFASQNPALNQTWGGNSLPLQNFMPIAPGGQIDVNFQAIAPTTPGTYNFQWQMYKNDGSGFFGQMSTNVAIQVGAPPSPINSAAFVSQNAPTSMTAGQTYSVSVTMSNTGTTTWLAGTYYLGSQNPQGNSTWGLNRVTLTAAVAPSSQAVFAFNVVAPNTPGTYNFQWQMATESTGVFGAAATNVPIQVSGGGTGGATAQFLRIDSSTRGNWRGVFGVQGYHVINEGISYPAYAQVSPSGHLAHTWASSTSDTRALEKSATSDRIAATWYSGGSFVINTNLTDNQTHQVALYCLDWDTTSRAQTIDILDATTNAVLDSRSVSAFNGGQYLVWNIKGNVKIRLTRTGAFNAVVSGIFFDAQGAAGNPSAVATFLKNDSATGGNWRGVYGVQGYHVINEGISYPAYAQVSPSGHLAHTWASTTSDTRALQKAATSDRIAATWYSGGSFVINTNLTDNQTHQVALYCLDWDTTSRTQTIDILDAATGALLDSKAVSAFNVGQYLVWNIKGNVNIRVTRTGGFNAVVSGIFFDAQGTAGNPSAVATFVKNDSATRGNWRGVYGVQGYHVINEGISYPAYAQVSPSGHLAHTWANSTSDTRALEKSATSDRIAATWYSGGSLVINTNLTDNQTHQVALYCLDWDTTSRAQTIEILDAATSVVLDSRSVSAFNGGQYLVWNIKGNVNIRVTRTSGFNAVVSGLFFDVAAPGPTAVSSLIVQ